MLPPADFVVFFGSLILVMVIGLWAGRKEDSSEDFYLAGRSTRWWGVAGSIFGTNVSANHIVGMMAVGFSLGFVESHFEITAIAGLLVLCYCLLPVYRKLGVFTLSDYLSQRYDDRSRVAYSLIMITIIVLVMMLPAFYIGSRTVNILLVDQVHIDAVLQTATTAEPQQIQINRTYYIIGVIIMAFVTGTYTIAGGLKAVIVTDVIQSVLMLLAAIIVAFLTFSQPEIGGWANLRAMDATDKDMFHLHLPSDHPARPWSGMVTGLMVLHFYYWGANQFIVQRALAAKTDKEARMGIITAGFFKLLIPFISIGTGIAAYYLFKDRNLEVAQDTVFINLLTELISPIGYGLVGLIAAGMIGAILSSLDSMMNSAATIMTFDLYKKYINPEADDQKLISVGRTWIVVFILFAGVLTIFQMDPNSQDSFFLLVAKHQGNLIAGVVVAFVVGMLWKGATAAGGVSAIIAGVIFSYGIPPLYAFIAEGNESLVNLFGKKLNFMHGAFISALLSLLVHIVVSKMSKVDPEKGKLTWTGLGIFTPEEFIVFGKTLAITLLIYGVLGILVVLETFKPVQAAWIGSLWTFGCFYLSARLKAAKNGKPIYQEDRFWAGGLAGSAIFMLYYFF